MIERVLVDSDATINGPVFSGADEEPADTTGTPTVAAVSRLTGTTLTAPVATALAAAGAYTAALTAAAHTGDVDVLDLAWTGTVSSKTRVLTQQVEVVGGYYASLGDLRNITALANASTQPAERLKRLRAQIEDIIEMARGVAYVPRAASVTLHSDGRNLRLPHRRVRELVRVTFDGVEQTLSRFEVVPETSLIRYDGGAPLPCDRRIAVHYRHGYDHPPTLLTEAVREYVRAKCLVDASSQNRNVSSVTNMATGEVYRFTQADPRFSRWTGIEEVDARINAVPDERVWLA